MNGTLAVKAGIKSLIGTMPSSLAGERETIQIHVKLVEPAEYETERTRIVDESRKQSAKHVIFIIGREVPDMDEKVREIYRCREIVQRHRSDPDQEVREYSAAQTDRAEGLISKLEHTLEHCFSQGSFIFQGETTAVESLDPSVDAAAKKYLGDVAELVFDRYAEAPFRAETSLAERFLRVGNLNAITPETDPLELVQISGGIPRINSDYRALISIKDHLDRFGTVDGKRLTDHFTAASFGWSPDTLRYLIAGLLLAGEVRLKVSGRDITVNGQQAIDALKNNNTFKTVGVALRDEAPPTDVLARASERLTELSGEKVIPLEDQISKAATKYFGQVQPRMTLLAERLEAMALPGSERIRDLNQELAEVLLTDGSDASSRLGSEESDLYNALSWGLEVDRALKIGLDATISELQTYRNEIDLLPSSGIPGQLQDQLEEEFSLLAERLRQENFFKYIEDFNSSSTLISACLRDTTKEMKVAFQNAIKQAQQDLLLLPGWPLLTQEERSQELSKLEELTIDVEEDLGGLKNLLNQEYAMSTHVTQIKQGIEKLGRERQLENLEQEIERARKEGQEVITRVIKIPTNITTKDQIDRLLDELQALQRELSLYEDIEIIIQFEGA